MKDINLKESKSMQNLICHRTMSDRTCLWLVKQFGLPVTRTGNFYQSLLYVQW